MTATILAFPTTNRTATAPAAEPTKRRTTRTRPKMRVEQVEVTCVRVPRKHNADLRKLSGVLTIDHKGDVPWTATFDPDDEGVKNIVAPIEKMERVGDEIRVITDEGLWTFSPIEDEGEEEHDGEDDDESEDDDSDDEE